MKLKVDFSEFDKLLAAMGTSKADAGTFANYERRRIEVKLSEKLRDRDVADIEDYNELQHVIKNPVGGLLAVGKNQITLYLINPKVNERELCELENKRPRYHLTDCKTLKEMREKDEFEHRYYISKSTSHEFSIKPSDKADTITLGLLPCQNCLLKLNYEKIDTFVEKQKFVRRFSLKKFFEENETIFRTLPTDYKENYPNGYYTADWSFISKRFRDGKNWICACCNGNFSDHRHLLHAHHINRKSFDNKASNLKALCGLCHQKEHDHQFIEDEISKLIKDVRKQQNHPPDCPNCNS